MHVIVGRLLNSSERIEPKHLKNTRFILERGTPAAWRQRVDITVQLCTCVDYMSLSAQYSVNIKSGEPLLEIVALHIFHARYSNE